LEIPDLPGPGPVRWIAIAGTLALASWLGALILALARRRWREALWVALCLAAGGVTLAAGSRVAWLHHAAALATLGIALGCAYAGRGAARWWMGAGALGWVVSLALARYLFGTV
jgi:hypothetical protein